MFLIVCSGQPGLIGVDWLRRFDRLRNTAFGVMPGRTTEALRGARS